MGSKGTFKPLCKRGHERLGNIDASGHCISCGRQKKNDLIGPTATGVFKPLCKRGHKRDGNTTPRGHCLTCMGGWRKTEIEYVWKYAGIKNEDGNPFNRNDFDRFYQIQGGMCKICGSHQSEMKGRLRVDHDHATGKFRGLLCHHCNTGLGMARDSAERLRSMAEYLEASR